jgi:hypothetical protein
METNLRPMSLGEILDRTAQLYRTNFLLFAGIAAIYAGIVLVLNLAQIGITVTLQHLHLGSQVPWVTIAYAMVILPMVFIFSCASIAANNRAVSWVYLGQSATIVGAYRSILPRLGRYLWTMTMMAFFIYWPFVLLMGGYLVTLFAYGGARGLFSSGGANTSPGAFGMIGAFTCLFLILALGWFVYAIIMILRYSLAIPASVVEDIKARPAIRRSIELSEGSRGRIFLLILLIVAIEIGLLTISQAFFFIEMMAAIKNHGELPVWIQITQQIVGFLTNSFIGPIYATGITLFYYDQRIRKEGFDIERMMEAAGMTAPPLTVEAQPADAPAEPSLEPMQPETPTAEAYADTGPFAQPAPAASATPAEPAEPDPVPPPENPHG